MKGEKATQTDFVTLDVQKDSLDFVDDTHKSDHSTDGDSHSNKKKLHETAAKYLEKLEQEIRTKDIKDSEEIFENLYSEVYDMSSKSRGSDYTSWIRSNIESSIKNASDDTQLQFKVIQFLEDWYNGYYAVNTADQDRHDLLFNIMIQDAYEASESNNALHNALGEIYHVNDYN